MPVGNDSLRKKALLRNKRKAQMGITTTELDKGAPFESYEVLVYVGPLITWQAVIVTASGKRIEMETKRASIKTWKSLDIALRDVLKHCADATRIRVDFEGRVFELRE